MRGALNRRPLNIPIVITHRPQSDEQYAEDEHEGDPHIFYTFYLCVLFRFLFNIIFMHLFVKTIVYMGNTL